MLLVIATTTTKFHPRNINVGLKQSDKATTLAPHTFWKVEKSAVCSFAGITWNARGILRVQRATCKTSKVVGQFFSFDIRKLIECSLQQFGKVIFCHYQLLGMMISVG